MNILTGDIMDINACYIEAMDIMREFNTPAYIHLNIGETVDNRLGQYTRSVFTITLNPSICQSTPAIRRYVVLHELGHTIAMSYGDRSEEAADKWAKQWYGNPESLLVDLNTVCKRGYKSYCELYKHWGEI